MSRSRMTMRAAIERNTESGTDADNNPLPPVFAAVATVPCFVWSRSRREVEDGTKTAIVEDLRAIFPLASNVAERDEIASVTDRRGAVLLAGRFRVEALQRKHRHLEAMLLQVS